MCLKQFAEILVYRNKIYTYEIPEGWELVVGQEVTVPLRQQKVAGYVLKFVPQPTFPVKPVAEIKSPIQLFTEDLVQLSEWMSAHYQCFLASALKTILPK